VRARGATRRRASSVPSALMPSTKATPPLPTLSPSATVTVPPRAAMSSYERSAEP